MGRQPSIKICIVITAACIDPCDEIPSSFYFQAFLPPEWINAYKFTSSSEAAIRVCIGALFVVLETLCKNARSRSFSATKNTTRLLITSFFLYEDLQWGVG
jgi:hypothetical protein